jgi:hypothetical protein
MTATVSVFFPILKKNTVINFQVVIFMCSSEVKLITLLAYLIDYGEIVSQN